MLRHSITTVKLKCCIGNPSLECSCGVCRTKKQRRSFQRPITTFVVLINQWTSILRQNLKIGLLLLLALHDQGLHQLCLSYDAHQFHGNYILQAPEPLHPTAPTWSFEAWVWTLLGPINRPRYRHDVLPHIAYLLSLLHSPRLYLTLIFLCCSCYFDLPAI